ncbi:unnamed protein product [Amaranthus hypochondriacus]
MSNTYLHEPSLNLPDEIIDIHILPKLPIKSLLRFKIVCKKWNSFISSPYFARLQLNQSSNNRKQHFLVNHQTHFVSYDCEDFVQVPKRNLFRIFEINEFHFPRSNIHIIGSCNGLVCLHNTKPSNSLYVWNPTTLVLREIPYPKQYEPNVLWGFGYVSSTNNYNIVRIFQSKSNKYIKEIKFFSLRNNRWKCFEEHLNYDFNDNDWVYTSLKKKIGVNANNSIYWSIAFRNEGEYGYINFKGCIIGFDLVAEKLMGLPFPESYSSGFVHPPLLYVTMDGSLGAYYWPITECHPASRYGEIGTFKKENGMEKWMNLRKVIRKYNIDEYDILGMIKKGSLVFYASFYRILFMYIISDDEDLQDFDTLDVLSESENFMFYVESLISPFG